MKNDINKELFIKSNLLNCPIKKTIISNIELTGYILNLELTSIYLNQLEEVDVVLKNVKTREVFIADASIKNSIITINLDSLSTLCTDNEFLLLIIIKRDSNYYVITPTLSYDYHSKCAKLSSLDLINITWYLRTIENGELRLSTVIKNLCSKPINLLQ